MRLIYVLIGFSICNQVTAGPALEAVSDRRPASLQCRQAISSSNIKINACARQRLQCARSCAVTECMPVASEASPYDAATGLATSAPRNVNFCAQQRNSCMSNCASSFDSCASPGDQMISQSCPGLHRPEAPIACREWSHNFARNSCEVERSRCGSGQYRCIYESVRCRQRLQSDLALMCHRPLPIVTAKPPEIHPVGIDRVPASDTVELATVNTEDSNIGSSH